MSVRFKFRSSVDFDSVGIDGKPSISIRDLRLKIIRHKKLNVCQDFDLVFSDALTGREYDDEDFQIPSGSSVIIKRVPAGTAPSSRAHIGSVVNHGVKGTSPFLPTSGQVDEFDDFGVDLSPIPVDIFPEFDNMNCVSSGKETIADSRLRSQRLENSELSEAIPGGSDHGGAAENILQKLDSRSGEHMKLEKMASFNSVDVQNAFLPSELKCSLCNTFFKEAVMIPCCQHSFCKKCICEMLTGKARCPRCSSTKCRVDDLLPNLSLRKAIDHFLESQLLSTASEYALRHYAPDGESGIEAREVSGAVTVNKKKPEFTKSHATEKESNQVWEDSFNTPLNNRRANNALNSVYSALQVKLFYGEKDVPEDASAAPDSQGENQPLNLPQTHVPDEADSTVNKKGGLWGEDPLGGSRNFMVGGRNQKAGRTCYRCGSPDHLIRNCPVPPSPHPMFQTGYAPPYWNSSVLPPMRPYMSMYRNPGMIPPFSPHMVPVTPYPIPQCVPSMYGVLPVPREIIGMPTGAERNLNLAESLKFEDSENRLMLSNAGRRKPFGYEDDSHKPHQYDESHRSRDEYKSHAWREKSYSHSHSEDKQDPKLRRRHYQDKHTDHYDERYAKSSHSSIGEREKSYHSERTNSGVEDMPHNTDRYSESSHKKHHYHESSKKQSHGSHHKERDAERRVESDKRDYRHRHNSRSTSGRWLMETSSDEDRREGQHHYKRRKVV